MAWMLVAIFGAVIIALALWARWKLHQHQRDAYAGLTSKGARHPSSDPGFLERFFAGLGGSHPR